ncbi:glycosyltransferase [Coralloluteibacterium stylophorae]|uniref:Glycosyltransferase n=1 Tax=Coralloluteibacterium stylophorae TaxID=1776034 RepID=A0AAP2FZW1_9GAMM|nr:glycosyltransferase [Coralloluteibacterium stylophorae]
MIGVIVPVHDEERLLAACLRSIRRAARDRRLHDEEVVAVVALDACSDGSAAVAAAHGVDVVALDARCVGAARAAAARRALELGARWIASTDADSRVPADWLAAQLAHAADVVCGTVRIEDWREHGDLVRLRYERGYRAADGHRHVHGANLGIAADRYLACGGFGPLRCGEDQDLVDRLQHDGARIVWTASPCVVTSARRDPRARGGFGDFLQDLAGVPA